MSLAKPALISGFTWFAKDRAWQFTKGKFISYMTNILKQNFSEPIMKGLAYFMASLIEENWDKISQCTSITQIGRFLLNNMFRGSGNLIFGNSNTTIKQSARKTWQQGTPIKFKESKK